MERWLLLLIFFLTTSSSFGATHSFGQLKQTDFINKEMHFLELRAKKEINDKKNTPLRKYTIAVLAAREFKLVEQNYKSLEFYKIASEIKVDIDKKEIRDALKKKNNLSDEEFKKPYFFEANLNELIANHSYEKAILALNPYALNSKENEPLRIVYDLLNVHMKKMRVKKLYCIDHANNDLEGLNYEGILCDFLNEYLKDGKKDKSHVAYIEDYFLRNDLNKRYLLNIVHDL